MFNPQNKINPFYKMIKNYYYVVRVLWAWSSTSICNKIPKVWWKNILCIWIDNVCYFRILSRIIWNYMHYHMSQQLFQSSCFLYVYVRKIFCTIPNRKKLVARVWVSSLLIIARPHSFLARVAICKYLLLNG